MRTRLFSCLMITLVHCLSFAHSSASTTLRKSSEHYTLSVCAIFQNEADWLQEWIEFHRVVGVEHFFLFNHLSQDNYEEVLRPYIEMGLVDLIEWDGPTQDLSQHRAYNYSLWNFGHRSKWIAFLDLDEFLFPVQERDLREILSEYEAYPALAVNWQFFGSSNINHLSEGELMIERLTWCAPPTFRHNRTVKCIVRPAVTKRIVTPHRFLYAADMTAVDSDRQPVPGNGNPRLPLGRLRINHYWTRTKRWALGEKLIRMRKPKRDSSGTPISFKFDAETILTNIQTFDEWCTVQEDTTIHRFLPALREQMASAPASSVASQR